MVYVKPKEYAAMIDHTGIFTLDKGDFFVIGDVKEELAWLIFYHT